MKRRRVEFSYWPMFKTTRRYGLYSNIYSTNPWSLIGDAIKRRCPASAKSEAASTIEQARYLYREGTNAEAWAAKPLLLYYSFLNLAKAYALTRGVRSTFDQAQHGLCEDRRGQRRELLDSYLRAFPSPGRRGPNLFSDYMQGLAERSVQQVTEYDLVKLLPQIVAGHRLWCGAAAERERFVGLHEIQIRKDAREKHLWLEVRILEGDLSRLDMSHADLLASTQLEHLFHEVKSTEKDEKKRPMLRFEQIPTTPYSHRPADKIPALVKTFRHHLWAAVTSVPPYRRYYLYAAPTAEHTQVLPQLCSIYAVFFYLGSLTRYRPQEFDLVMSGKYGGQVQELLSTQPSQFLYLMASEFAQREVTRPAIV